MYTRSFPILGFNKIVPSDMSWGGTYGGGYVIVTVLRCGNWPPNTPDEVIYDNLAKKYPESPYDGMYMVSIHGTHNVACVRFFQTWEGALAVYNRTRYLHSLVDLADFREHLVGSNNNGMPWERDNSEWDSPEEKDLEDFMNKTPVPWPDY